MTSLPPVIDDIARLIGEPAALALAEHYQGQRLYIPADPAPEHTLCKLIGCDAARRLADRHGSQTIEIPMLHARRLDLRNQAIRRDSAHMSYADLVRKWRISRRQIANILRAGNEADAKPKDDLFEEAQ